MGQWAGGLVIWFLVLLFPPPTVIRGRSADNRKAPLIFSFPLEGKCHEVAKGCTWVRMTMLLQYHSTQGQLRLLWRPSAGSPQKRRISVSAVSRRKAIKYRSAGRALQVPGPCMNSYGFILATHRDSSPAAQNDGSQGAIPRPRLSMIPSRLPPSS